MGSDWKFHTSITPRKYLSMQTDDNNNQIHLTSNNNNNDYNTFYKEEFNLTLNKLFNELLIPQNVLNKHLYTNSIYTHEIHINDEKDDILNPDSSYHIKFLRSRFLKNPKLKKLLIQHYNPIGFFIKGPLQKTDNLWIIEYSYKILPFINLNNNK